MRRMYSEKQLVQVIEEQDLKPKTLEQQEPNWAYDVEEFPSTTGCTSEVTFCRIQKINGELHIIMQGKVNNATGSDKTVYNLSGIYVTLPSEIASKIFDVNGNPASEGVASDVRITAAPCQIYKNSETGMNFSYTETRGLLYIMNTSQENRILISFGVGAGVTLINDKDTYFEGRIFLDLI